MNNTGVTILTILVPSIPKHFYMLKKLLKEFDRQITDLNNLHPMLGTVEVLFDDSKSFLNGGLSIGKKRQALVERATGKYLCFCDADDLPSPSYIETLMRLCQDNEDIVTFRNFTKTDFYWTVIDMSIDHENEQATPERIVKRLPWHICPVKSEYAKLYEFEDSNYGEDFSWMSKVLTNCKSEAHTDQVLHCYQHSSKHSEADKITTNGLLAKP